MSQKPQHNRRPRSRERSAQETLLTRVDRAQPRQYNFFTGNSYENQGELSNEASNQAVIEQIQQKAVNIPTSDSYDIIRSDDKPSGWASSQDYFDELYGQEKNYVTTHSSERYAGGRSFVQRSRSMPASDKLAENFLHAELMNVVDADDASLNDSIENEYVHQDNLVGRRSRNQSSEDDVAQYNRNRSPSKKVSYAQEASAERSEKAIIVPKRQTSPVQCVHSRFRADIIESDTSEASFTASNPNSRRSNRSNSAGPSPSTRPRYLQQPPLPLPPPPHQSNSDRSVQYNEQSWDDVLNHNPNYRASNRYSQDSFLGFGSSSALPSPYDKDVLPLPIEIPDNVADAEAFRRYLSVRRGAITPVQPQNFSFEKRNHSSPSYESIGRRSRNVPGITPSGQLGQEAGRRTSSLSHAIMTIALLSASIGQLRFLLTYSHAHAYPILNYFLVFTSLILEVAAGIGYVLIARCSYDDVQAESIQNYLIFALFIVAVSNIILAAFAFDDHLCEEMHSRTGRTSAASVASQDQQLNHGSRADGALDLRYMPLE